MDPFLVLIVVIVIGIALTNRSSDECFFFDLFCGRMADPNYSTNRINDEFNGFFCVLLTAVVLAGGCLLFSSFADVQPKRVFIPIEERRTTVASANSHKKQTVHKNSKSHNGTKIKAPQTHRDLAHKATAHIKY